MSREQKTSVSCGHNITAGWILSKEIIGTKINGLLSGFGRIFYSISRSGRYSGFTISGIFLLDLSDNIFYG